MVDFCVCWTVLKYCLASFPAVADITLPQFVYCGVIALLITVLSFFPWVVAVRRRIPGHLPILLANMTTGIFFGISLLCLEIPSPIGFVLSSVIFFGCFLLWMASLFRALDSWASSDVRIYRR